MKSLSRYIFAVLLAAFAFAPKDAAAQLSFSKPVDFVTGKIDLGTGKFATLNNPISIAVGDFNDDGKLDLAAINGLPVKVGTENNFYLSILFGDGLGGFPAPATTSVIASCPATILLTQCNKPVYLVAGKFDGDNKTDLAVVYSGIPQPKNPNPVVPGSVAILLSVGDGTFTASAPITVGLVPVFAAVGQLTGSGNLDLVVANRDDDTISILLGDGSGGFTVHDCNGSGSACAVGKKPVSIAIGSFNSSTDSIPDLAVANFDENNISLLKGDGAGGFTGFASATPETVLVGMQPISIVSGDFNGDSNADLAVVDQQRKGVIVLLSQGDGTFTVKKEVVIGKIPVQIALGDFNGDTATDFVSIFFPGHVAAAFPGNGDGTFSKGAQLKTTGGGVGNFAIAVADFDGDGHDDLAIANGKISVLLNISGVPDPGFNINVTDPDGATVWHSGTPQNVTWTSAGFAGNVRIDFSTDSGANFKTLLKTAANATSPASATVPKAPATTTSIATARVRVCSVNFPGICGESADFTLTP